MAGAQINGKALTMAVLGGALLWTGITDPQGNPKNLLQTLLKGKHPSGASKTPAVAPDQGGTATSSTAAGAPLSGTPGSHAGQILAIAGQMKGFPYCYGGGHGAPCAGNCDDCSGYVSCVLHQAGLLNTTMATGGFLSYGTAVPYAQRAPGDLIVWSGGLGGIGHMGIVIDASTMWNNPCTRCGGVQISHYPYGRRTAAAAHIRRP